MCEKEEIIPIFYDILRQVFVRFYLSIHPNRSYVDPNKYLQPYSDC